MKRALSSLLVGLVLLGAGIETSYAAIPPVGLWSGQGTDPRPLLVMDEKLQLIPVVNHQRNPKLAYTIDTYFPQITGTPLNATAQHFNQAVQTLIQQQTDPFLQDIHSSATNTLLPKTTSTLKINYEMASFASQSQQTEYLSIRFTIKGYERGMAHPYQRTAVLNYDLGHDTPLTIANLFKPGTRYLLTVANYCKQQLLEKKLPADMVTVGAATKFKNYQNWNLTLRGLLITFDEAQVAPRYFGAQEVIVPNSVLATLYTQQAACTLSITNCDKT